MSLSRKTYSPMSHTYSYASNVTPTYSYSRVSTYLDALQRDQQINKLKKEITSVKSLEMKYYALLQEISVAQKQNRMLEVRNGNVQQEYVGKIQESRKSNQQLESQLENIGARLSEEEKKVASVEKEIQDLLQELKQLKLEEESVEKHNAQLQTEVEACNSHMTKLVQEQAQLTAQKSALNEDSKTCAHQMQSSMKRLTELTEQVAKYQQELALLQSQSQCFSLQCKNIQTLCGKNATLIQNLERKVTIQEGENQQLKNQLASAQKEWENMQAKFVADKDTLYQNVIKIEEHSLQLKQTLEDLDRFLETDSTEKKYLRDISNKHSMLLGQNEQIRQLLKHLQDTLNEKKTQEAVLIQEINRKLRSDESVKCAIDQRGQELSKLRSKFSN